MYQYLTLTCLVSVLLSATSHADELIPRDPPLRWWKGNIHTHSLWSDGDDFPEMIAEWYRTHEYNFLALSDHNVLSEGDRWMKVAAVEARGGPTVLPKYRDRFGGGWVQLRSTPGGEDHEVRLKPLDEFRALVEQRGQFIMIPAEEISDSVGGAPVHMNATNLLEVVQPLGGATVREAINNNLRVVEEQAKARGREILVHLNHPNFGYAVTAEDLAAVLRERFFEVYNGHPGVAHNGDELHPGIERMWDIANTIRIGDLAAAPLFGVATDDSHTYHGKPGSHTGRGWVMVRSRYLTPEHLIRAMRAGEFYASSGVSLKDVNFDAQRRKLSIVIAGDDVGQYTTRFIGTCTGYDRSTQPRSSDTAVTTSRVYSDDVGATLSEVAGLTPSYQFTGDELYVRAVVTSTTAHPDPSFTGQKQQAWTQPFQVAK